VCVSRWFSLHGTQLFYYEDESHSRGGASQANGCLMVAGATLRVLDAGQAGRKHAFGLIQPCSTRMYIMAAPTEQAMINWLSVLVQAGAVAQDPPTRSVPKATTVVEPVPVSAAVAAAQRPMFACSAHEGWLLKVKNKPCSARSACPCDATGWLLPCDWSPATRAAERESSSTGVACVRPSLPACSPVC